MIRLFRIGGIPVNAEPAWFVVVALFAWVLASGYFPQVLPGRSIGAYVVDGIVAALLLFVCVLLHELSHALVARAHGVAVGGITLHVLGGVSQLEAEPATPRAELLIAAVGPMTSLALALGCQAAVEMQAGPPALLAVLGYLVAVNVVLGLFNLVPGFPLDGGRILRAAIWWWRGSFDRATAIAATTGSAVAITLVAYGALRGIAGDLVGGVWLALIGLFLRRAAAGSAELARVRGRLQPVAVESLMAPAPHDVAPAERAVERGASAWDAFLKLADGRDRRVVVREGRTVVGVVTREALRAVIGSGTAAPAERRAA